MSKRLAYYVPALAALVGLGLATLPAPAAAQSACRAVISLDKIEEGSSDNWTLWLSVDTGSCNSSSGEFDYTLVIRRSSGSLDEVAKKGSWGSERARGSFTLEHRLASGEKLADAREFRDIRCSCGSD